MDLRDWMISDHAGVLGRFEQAIAAHVPRDRWTEQADDGGTSIAALLYHLTRHQDLAITVAVSGRTPVLAGHADALGVAGLSSSAGLSETEDRTLTARLDLTALQAYAAAVHASTQDVLAGPTDWSTALDETPATGERLETLAGVLAADVPWLHAMWGGKSVAWLVQWPGIGHGHAHVGEATSIRNRMGLSPF